MPVLPGGDVVVMIVSRRGFRVVALRLKNGSVPDGAWGMATPRFGPHV
jgi:hypothetical protein